MPFVRLSLQSLRPCIVFAPWACGQPGKTFLSRKSGETDTCRPRASGEKGVSSHDLPSLDSQALDLGMGDASPFFKETI